MAHNLCCDSYHVTYICYTIVIILGSSMWCVLCLLWLYWFSCFLVFWWMGWGVPVHLFFVVCCCFLFWIGCVLSNYFFLWDGCRLLRAVVGGLLSLCSFPFLWGWMTYNGKPFTPPACFMQLYLKHTIIWGISCNLLCFLCHRSTVHFCTL